MWLTSVSPKFGSRQWQMSCKSDARTSIFLSYDVSISCAWFASLNFLTLFAHAPLQYLHFPCVWQPMKNEVIFQWVSVCVWVVFVFSNLVITPHVLYSPKETVLPLNSKFGLVLFLVLFATLDVMSTVWDHMFSFFRSSGNGLHNTMVFKSIESSDFEQISRIFSSILFRPKILWKKWKEDSY